MKRLLVPTDFSKLSRSAALYAIDLAAKWNARVMLVSVVEIEQGSSKLMNWKKLQDQMERDAAEQSEAFMKELHRFSGGVSLSYTTLIGAPIADRILSFAKENKADLIIAGTRGASGLKAAFFGSNAAALINKSSIPVIAIPGDLKYNGFDRIVLATDMESLDKEAKIVAKFAKDFDAQIDVLHVSDEQRSERSHKDLEAILIRMTGYKKISIHVITDKDITKGLNNYAREKGIDLVVMFTHELGLIERIFNTGHTRDMAFRTGAPLLTFKRQA